VPALTEAPVSPFLLNTLITLLGDLGGDAAASALTTLLDLPSLTSLQRGEALRALGQTGAPRAVVTLLALAAAPTMGNVPATAHGSPNTGLAPATALDGLLAWATQRGRLDAAAVDPLLDLLHTPAVGGGSMSARASVIARLLGETRNPRAAPALASLLDSPDAGLRRAAASGLRLCGVSGVEDTVAAALSDPLEDVRLGAS